VRQHDGLKQMRSPVLRLFNNALAILACFAGGYFGLTWLQAGAPLPLPTVAVGPTTPNASLPTFAQAQEQAKRNDWQNRQTAQSDKDPERDKLRLDLIQAAGAFKQSSCDKTMKANLVNSLTAYAMAWADKSGCKPFPCGGAARVELAANMFSTPLDLRVREAVGEAFQQGGITVDDFPRAASLHVAMIAGDRGDPETSCSVTRASKKR